MTRALAALALLLLPLPGGCGRAPAVPAAVAHPMRVMSIGQCADQIVLTLLPPARIASITWLSHRPGGTAMPAAAARVGANHGLIEEVLAEKPDLIVSGTYNTPALRAALTRLGYPLVTIPAANDVADIRALTRQVAAAVDERARGEALIAGMDAQLAALARDRGPAMPVVAWDHTGFAAGKGSLFDVILTLAGARNLVRGERTLSYRRPDVETLLAADPVLLVEGASDPRAVSLGDAAIHHPLVRRLWGDRTLLVPQIHYVCGTPAIADAAWRLRGALHAAAARAGSRPPLEVAAR